MKVILISTPKGQFYLPVQKVAEHRADFYACELEGYERNSPEWQDEVNWVVKDDFEAIDWLINNTNWEDWESSAIKVNDKVQVTDDDFWRSSDGFEIVDNFPNMTNFNEFSQAELMTFLSPYIDKELVLFVSRYHPLKKLTVKISSLVPECHYFEATINFVVERHGELVEFSVFKRLSMDYKLLYLPILFAFTEK